MYLSSYEGFMVDTIPMSCALVRKRKFGHRKARKDLCPHTDILVKTEGEESYT